MLKTEMRNPSTTHIDRMSTAEMVRIIQDENVNAAMSIEKAYNKTNRITYQAEEGMSWNDWVSSIYNTSGLVVSESGRICVTYSDDYFCNCVFSNDERTYGYIYDGTVVAEGEIYVMASGSYSN